MAHLVQSVAVRHVDDNEDNETSLDRRLLTVPRGLAVCADVSGGGWRKRKRGPIEALVSPKTKTVGDGTLNKRRHKFMGCSMSPLMRHASDQALTIAGMCEVYFLPGQKLNTCTLGTPVYVGNVNNNARNRGRFTTVATVPISPKVGFFVNPTSEKSGMIYVQLVESPRGLALRSAITDYKKFVKTQTTLGATITTTEEAWLRMPLEERGKLIGKPVIAVPGDTSAELMPEPVIEAPLVLTFMNELLKQIGGEFKGVTDDAPETIKDVAGKFAERCSRLAYTTANEGLIRAQADVKFFASIKSLKTDASQDAETAEGLATTLIADMRTLAKEGDFLDEPEFTSFTDRARDNKARLPKGLLKPNASDGQKGRIGGHKQSQQNPTFAPMGASELEQTTDVEGGELKKMAVAIQQLWAKIVAKPAASLGEQIGAMIDPELYEVASAIVRVLGFGGDNGDVDNDVDNDVVDALMTNAVQAAFALRIALKFDELGVDASDLAAAVIAAKGDSKFSKKLKSLRKAASKEVGIDDDVEVCMAELERVFRFKDGELPQAFRADLCRIAQAGSDHMASLTECREAGKYVSGHLVDWVIDRMTSSSDEFPAFMAKGDTPMVQRGLVLKFLIQNFDHLPDECKIPTRASTASSLRA